MIINNSKGITLLEAFISAFIFLISVSAIFASLASLRKPAVTNEQQVAAALLGRAVLEDLRSQVDTQSSQFLQEGQHCPALCPASARSSSVYSLSYIVSCINPISQAAEACSGNPNDIRQVKLNVTWNSLP